MLDRIELITCMPISLMDTELFVSPPSPFRQRMETEIRHVEKDAEMGFVVVVQMRDVPVVFVVSLCAYKEKARNGHSDRDEVVRLDLN